MRASTQHGLPTAAQILIEAGQSPVAATAAVREQRPGAIETVGQERSLLSLSGPTEGTA
jgi:hypothetical protein